MSELRGLSSSRVFFTYTGLLLLGKHTTQSYTRSRIHERTVSLTFPGHNLESSQNCADLLNHWEGMFFCQFSSILLQYAELQKFKRLRKNEDIEISKQNSKGEQQGDKLLRLLSGFRPRIRLNTVYSRYDLQLIISKEPSVDRTIE